MSKEDGKDITSGIENTVLSSEAKGLMEGNTEAIKEECRHPIDVEPFWERARSYISEIRDVVPLTSAILDDWNTGEGIEGARIIYGAPCVVECRSQCSSCSLFRTVGEDNPQVKTDFRATLCRATEGQLNLFPNKQRFLNCKTLEGYQEAFVRWIVEECDSPELIRAELDWVKGFRILFLNGKDNVDFLKERDRECKIYIVRESLKRLREKMDLQRAEIISAYGKQIGLKG